MSVSSKEKSYSKKLGKVGSLDKEPAANNRWGNILNGKTDPYLETEGAQLHEKRKEKLHYARLKWWHWTEATKLFINMTVKQKSIYFLNTFFFLFCQRKSFANKDLQIPVNMYNLTISSLTFSPFDIINVMVFNVGMLNKNVMKSCE